MREHHYGLRLVWECAACRAGRGAEVHDQQLVLTEVQWRWGERAWRLWERGRG